MFKVVADQLKVAQGWVRCGQCAEVFEASLHLVSDPMAGQDAQVPGHDAEPALDQAVATQAHETPAALSFQVFPVAKDPAEHRMNALAIEPFLLPESSAPVQDAAVHPGQSGLDAPEGAPVQPVPAQEAGSIEIDALPAALTAAIAAPQYPPRIDPIFTGDAYGFRPDSPGADEAVGLGAAAPEEARLAAEAPESPEVAAGVSFVRDAQRRAFWQTPLVRVGLGLLFALLLAALALQWVVRQKDVLAAQEPRLAPLLQALCRPLGCEIRPPRRIGSVLIDSANFSKTGPDAYRLTFVLKNTGAAALEIPALEVTLTDSQDQALVRRVLMPAQFAAGQVALSARSELAGTLSLKVAADGAQAAAVSTAGALPVAGYRLLAFYP
jgi:predicted Zn finger-like uncharacterized protein